MKAYDYFRFFKRIRVAFVLLLCLSTFKTTPQNSSFQFDRLTVKDGLSHSNVYAIAQDQYGYLWFGTQDGLNRYDGREIVIFRSEIDNPNSLSSSNFGKILVDNEGVYWFGTFGGGIDRYDPKTDTFKHYKHESNNSKSISNNQIIFIFQDSEGLIWFGTPDGGLNRYNRETDDFTRFQHDPNNPKSLSGNRAKCMVESSDGTLWVGTDRGLNKFNKQHENFEHFKYNPNNSNSLSGDFIQNMVANDDGSLWIVTHGGGLNHFDVKNSKFTHYKHNPNDPWSLSDNKADCILKDSNGDLWIGTYEGGLNKFDIETKRFIHYKHNPNNFFSISNNRIEYLYEDSSKILWIATRGGGLNKIDLKPKKFHNIKYNPNTVRGLTQHTIMAISSDEKGNIWLGTDGGGLAKYNLATGDIYQFGFDIGNKNSLSSNRVWSVHVDKRGTVWAGTYTGGLNRIEENNGDYLITHYQNIPENPQSICNNQVNCIFEDIEGNLWFGTADGLSLLSNASITSDLVFENYKYSTSSSNISTVDNYVNSIVQDQLGRIWVGSYQNGLFEFNTNTKQFDHFKPIIKDSVNFLNEIRILTICVDSKNNFWVGTESGGLINFDIDNRSVSLHPHNDVLKNKMIIGMVEDSNQNLWIVSTRGLYKYSLNSSSMIRYSFDDGIEADGFNRNSYHKTDNGFLLFGGNAALTYFNPNEVVSNSHIPKVTITDFKVLAKSIWDKSIIPYRYRHIEEPKTVVLDHKDYFFSISFASFDFTNPRKNSFQYMLEGFDKDWIDAGTSNQATYTNLNAGRYLFKVKGSNNDKVWNEHPVELTIRVKPPLWKHPWFIVLESLFFALLVFLYIRYRTYRLRVDKHTLESKVNERTNELNLKNNELEITVRKLKDTQYQLIQSEKMASVGVLTAGISHEINNPLNYIHGSISLMESYINDNLEDHHNELIPLVDIINEGVVRATNVVRSLDQFSKISEVYTDFCDVNSIINNCLFMLKHRFGDRIIVDKNFDENLPPIQGNEGKLHQVFFNVLANSEQSIEEEGRISISTSVLNDEVIITVADTGCGISKEIISRITEPFFTTKDPGKGTGLGLSITYSIVKEHKGKIVFDSEKGVGTTVIISFPIRCR